ALFEPAYKPRHARLTPPVRPDQHVKMIRRDAEGIHFESTLTRDTPNLTLNQRCPVGVSEDRTSPMSDDRQVITMSCGVIERAEPRRTAAARVRAAVAQRRSVPTSATVADVCFQLSPHTRTPFAAAT